MPVINSGLLDGVRRIGAKVRELTVDGGLPGAPLGFRMRGAITAGPPTVGTWRAGDEVRDRAGVIWICTAAGTPGTWTGTVSASGAGTSGQVLTSQGTGMPQWQNSSSGFANPMTTAGDLLYENSTPAPGRLPVGASNQILTVLAGLPAWQSLDSSASDIAAVGTVSTGSTNKVADAGHAHAFPLWLPSDNGLLTANFPLELGTAQTTLTAGTLYLIKLPFRAQTTLTYLWLNVSTQGAGASSGSYAGLYSSSGSLLTGSSDIGSSFTSAGNKQVTLTAPQTISAGSFVWAAFIFNLLTTQPSLTKTGVGTALNNINLSASAYRSCVNGSAATTVAAGSNTGEISQIATWSSPSAGVLDVASVTGYPSSGSVAVAASGTTLAEIAYTGTSTGQFTGCNYVSGSATGTVATGGAVTMASLPSTITPSGNSQTNSEAFWTGGS